MNEIVDLRSDTVTRPSPGMRAAIAAAEVGDDVLGDDPTVLRLQERVARLLGKEAALFVPSGSMANLVAIRGWTQPGDEIIADVTVHSYNYESAGPAAIGGCSFRLMNGPRGIFSAADVEAAIRPPDSHFPHTRLVIIENTTNRGGGSIWPVETVAAVGAAAHRHGLVLHIDGARLLNACVAGKLKPTDYTQHADSVSICFSKGLGAPIGSIVAGPKDFIGARIACARCSAAACGRWGFWPRRRITRWITTSSGWPKIMPTHAGWRRRLPSCRAFGLIRATWRPISSCSRLRDRRPSSSGACTGRAYGCSRPGRGRCGR